LENAVLHAASLCDQVVYPEHLPLHVQKSFEKSRVDSKSPEQILSASPEQDEWLSLDEIEAKYVAQVLSHTGGNKQAAARILKIDRKTLMRIIKRHNLDS
jgi:DNA-binding NtrC family response regulator